MILLPADEREPGPARGLPRGLTIAAIFVAMPVAMLLLNAGLTTATTEAFLCYALAVGFGVKALSAAGLVTRFSGLTARHRGATGTATLLAAFGFVLVQTDDVYTTTADNVLIFGAAALGLNIVVGRADLRPMRRYRLAPVLHGLRRRRPLPPRAEDLERLPVWIDHVLAEVPAASRAVLTPFANWYVLRRLRRDLDDDDLPSDVRAAGALMLLFGMMTARIARLGVADVIDDGDTVFLNIKGHGLQLPPKVAVVICRQRDDPRLVTRVRSAAGPSPWLFPGQHLTQPTHGSTLQRRLLRHGIATSTGRNIARMALVARLPASVLADLTGTSISSAEAWKKWSSRDWTDYIATRDTGGPDADQ